MLRSPNADDQAAQVSPPFDSAMPNTESNMPAGDFVLSDVDSDVVVVPLEDTELVPEDVVELQSISMDEVGFDPSELTIPVGTTVVFLNNGQAPHWPASDPHPTHTDLSAFDAKKGLATGESFSYTFTEAGTYGIHDHLNPKAKGTIIVE